MAVSTSVTYRNGDSPVDILLPEDMSSSRGYVISRGGLSVEVRPAAGNFEDGVAVDNAIRYSNVFDNVDFQYTVLGNTIKEDIILLEPQERNEFSYYLKSDSLKFKKQDGCVVAYETTADEPVFVFRAPIMYDADGCSSIDIDLDFSPSSGKLTITADEDWLKDEDRAYPVRIDPDMSLMDSQDTYMTFDITEIYHTWFDDPSNRNGLMMRVEVEGPTETLDDVMWADTLARGTDPTVPPSLEVSWYGDLAETDPGQMDINDFTIEVGPGMTETENGSNTTAGVVAYGQSQAESTISYTLKRVSGGTVTSDETTAESEWLYPDYTLVEEACVDAILKNANWQSEASMYDDDLRLNTIYQYEAQATGYEMEEDPETGELVPTGEEVTSEVKESDEFLLYKVQATDLISRIAKYYGTSTEQIKADNQLEDRLTEAGTILFIRNPGTDVPYTFEIPQDKMERFLLECALNGEDPRCLTFGEPVNTSTGSFYMSQTDSELEDLGGTFSITRSYGSTTPYFRSEFGMGWNSLAGEKIMVLEDETRTASPSTARAAGDEGDEEEEEDSSSKVPAPAGWKLSHPDGTVKIFNAYGMIIKDGNRKDQATLYAYDGDWKLTQITTPSGKIFEVTQDDEGKITQIVQPDGGSITYEYNEADDLIQVTNPAGDTRRYEYDEEHHMTAWYDENGNRVVLNTYDGDGRVVTQTDALGSTMTFQYEADGTTVADNRGNATKFVLDGQKRNIRVEYANGQTEHTAYDEANRIASRTDANGTTTSYTYDEKGNVLTETREDGSGSAYSYNELNLPLTATDYEGNTSSFTYDEVGNLLSMTITSRNLQP